MVASPSATSADPASVLIVAPPVVREMSNTPLATTADEVAIEPVPLSASPAPEAINVAPV